MRQGVAFYDALSDNENGLEVIGNNKHRLRSCWGNPEYTVVAFHP